MYLAAIDDYTPAIALKQINLDFCDNRAIFLSSDSQNCSIPAFLYWCETMRHLAFNACVLAMLAAYGCGKTDPLNRQAVSGEIKLNGEPLKAGSIEFTPAENGNPSGASIHEGAYSVPQEKGLPPGDYIVRISASNSDEQPVEVPGESNKIALELIPAKYNTKSILRFHVDSKAENVFSVDMEKKR